MERAEDAAAKGLAELRAQFQDVTRRNGLHGDAELATELADMMTRPVHAVQQALTFRGLSGGDLSPRMYWSNWTDF